jgi:hypothetical protein
MEKLFDTLGCKMTPLNKMAQEYLSNLKVFGPQDPIYAAFIAGASSMQESLDELAASELSLNGRMLEAQERCDLEYARGFNDGCAECDSLQKRLDFTTEVIRKMRDRCGYASPVWIEMDKSLKQLIGDL